MADTKEAVCRQRHQNVLKTTIESAEKLTANADASSVIVFRDELEISWAKYSAAFNSHEDSLVGRNEPMLSTISAEFTTMHKSYLTTKVHLGKLIAANQANGSMNSTMFDATAHDGVKIVKMPPVKITPFSGELKDWAEFKATCRSILIEKIPPLKGGTHWRAS